MRRSAWNHCIGVMLILLSGVVMASLVVGCGAKRGPGESAPPPVEREPLVAIGAIDFMEQDDFTRVTIQGSRELTLRSLGLLESPLRISVNIPNASVGTMTPISVNNGTVTEIIATADESGGRVDIGLTDMVPYKISREANSIYIDIERARREKAVEVEERAVVEEVGALTRMEAAIALKGISVEKRGDVTEVVVTADGIIGNYDTFTLDSPPRLVLDLLDLKSVFDDVETPVPANTSQLIQIRIGRHPEKIRLVFDTSGSKPPPYRIDQFQNELVIGLGAVGSM